MSPAAIEALAAALAPLLAQRLASLAAPRVENALLNAEQAGALLSVPATWVLAEARANRIPHVRLGHYVRFDPQVLERWWKGRARGPTEGANVVGSRTKSPHRTRPGGVATGHPATEGEPS